MKFEEEERETAAVHGLRIFGLMGLSIRVGFKTHAVLGYKVG
jgi:hypothetical protein